MLIKLSQSGSVHGPWLERVVYDFDANGHGQAHDANQWDCDVKDPSFVVHSDGRTVIAYRATCCDCGDHTERIGLLARARVERELHSSGHAAIRPGRGSVHVAERAGHAHDLPLTED